MATCLPANAAARSRKSQGRPRQPRPTTTPAAPVGCVVGVGPGVFDAQEVYFRPCQRASHQERSFTHANFDFERVIIFKDVRRHDRLFSHSRIEQHTSGVRFGVLVASKMFRRIHSHGEEDKHLGPRSKNDLFSTTDYTDYTDVLTETATTTTTFLFYHG